MSNAPRRASEHGGTCRTLHGGEEWDRRGEAPVGHISLSLVALHALWDAWIHERDIAAPLGLEQAPEPDEVLGCLLYVSALSPSSAVTYDTGQRGALEVRATDPATRLVVEVDSTVTSTMGPAPAGAVPLSGDAVPLVEALSVRVSLAVPVADEHRWMFDGLATAFDAEPRTSPATEP